jgi:murein DD-endopeptidase MepM/ murein hydrolase activator NlpD
MTYKFIFLGLFFVPVFAACSSSSLVVKKNTPVLGSDTGSLAAFCSHASTSPLSPDARSKAYSDRRASFSDGSSVQQSNKNALAGHLFFPVAGGCLSSPFGYRRNSFHSGVDITAARGEPIFACADGQVVFAGTMKAYKRYGKMVVIDHGGHIHTRYAHASRVLVGAGQKVWAGEKIALVGSTGRATSPHLHLEVEVSGKLYNPVACFAEDQLQRTRVASNFPLAPRDRIRNGRPLSELVSFLRD